MVEEEDAPASSAPGLNPAWQLAVLAAADKQAESIVALDLRGVTTMADVFIICHGRNPKQVQTISDEVELRLKKEAGERPLAIEGFNTAEWILLDYGDMVVHVFSEKARAYYDLERLYRGALSLPLPEEAGQPA